MSSPRAQLTMRTPFFMMAMEVLLMRPSVCGGEADVQREVVGLAEDLVDGDEGDVVLAGDDGRDEGVVADEVHAEGLGAAGDFEADAAEADDAEGLAAELGALQGFLVPLAGVHGGVGARDGAAHRDHEAEGEFGDGDGVGAGGVHDDDAARVAAAASMLSTPTPARPMMRSLGAAASSLASAWTAERTMRASASASSAGRSVIWSAVTTFQPGSFWRMARVAGETFSARTIFNVGDRHAIGGRDEAEGGGCQGIIAADGFEDDAYAGGDGQRLNEVLGDQDDGIGDGRQRKKGEAECA
jgi:hypothetical protein